MKKSNEKNAAIIVNSNESKALFPASVPEVGTIIIKRNARFVRPATMRAHSGYALFVNVKKALGKALKNGGELSVISTCALSAQEYGAYCAFASYHALSVVPVEHDETGAIVTSIKTSAVAKAITLG